MTQQTYIMLTADEGKMLTNGTVYGKYIALGKGDKAENYYEITEEEYRKRLEEEAEEQPGEEAEV